MRDGKTVKVAFDVNQREYQFGGQLGTGGGNIIVRDGAGNAEVTMLRPRPAAAMSPSVRTTVSRAELATTAVARHDRSSSSGDDDLSPIKRYRRSGALD